MAWIEPTWGWTVPSEDEDPYFGSFQSMVTDISQTIADLWTPSGVDLYRPAGKVGIGRAPLAGFDNLGNALFQWGADASDLSPRTSNSTVSISTQRTDASGEFHGVESVIKSKSGSAQVSYGYTSVTYNYADHSTGESGTMVGFYHYGEAHGHGWEWSFAGQIEDKTGNASLVGMELLLIRNVPSSNMGVGLNLLSGGNQALDYALMIDGYTGSTWDIQILGLNEAITSGGKFIDLQTGGGGTSLFSVDRSGNCTPASIYTEAWHDVGTSGQPSFQNSWVNANDVWGGSSYSTAGFCKDAAGFVHLKGLVINGVVGPSGVIFTLPSSYRPIKYSVFCAIAGQYTTEIGRIDVSAAGEVIAYFGDISLHTFIGLDGISFRAA